MHVYHLLLKSQWSHATIICHFKDREMMKLVGEHALLLLVAQQQPLDALPCFTAEKVLLQNSAFLTPAKHKNRAELSEAGRMSGVFFSLEAG